MIALIEKTEFGTFMAKIYLENRLVDVWECRTVIHNTVKVYELGDSVLNITDVHDGYKLYMEHGGQVMEAILCKKVYVQMGVTI